MPRRNPTRTIYDDAHAEKSETSRPPEYWRTRHARALALTKLIPLRTAKRTFSSLNALAEGIDVDPARVRYWQETYPSAAHIIKKLLATSA